jgi:hypothetical protein
MKALAGIILADQQFPNDNPVLLNQVEKFMASHHWDYAIYLGDGMDMDAISHHAFEAGDRRSTEGKRLKKDYEAYAKILRRHRKILGPKCTMIYFLGNHEEWTERMVDTFPGIEGMIEPRYCLPFDELNIEVIDYRMPKKIGKLVFLHGDQDKGYYGTIHHAKKYVELYNRNLVYGDKHTLQVFTKISPAGMNETHTAYSIPCLADIHPKWNRSKPTAWLNGFGVFYLTEQRFTVIPIVAIHNGFIGPDGIVYEP